MSGELRVEVVLSIKCVCVWCVCARVCVCVHVHVHVHGCYWIYKQIDANVNHKIKSGHGYLGQPIYQYGAHVNNLHIVPGRNGLAIPSLIASLKVPAAGGIVLHKLLYLKLILCH